MNKKISIIMATYNMGHFIYAIINSTLNQSFTDYEFIIVDDNSDDNTLSIINSFKDPRIIIIKNNENLKSGKSRNIAIDLASGKYIAICDADDINMPHRLDVQLKYLEAHPEIDVVGSNSFIFNSKGAIIGGLGNKMVGHQDLVKNIFREIPLIHPTIMGKADWFKKFKYREEFYRAQDYELFLRSHRTSRFANIPEFLYAYRDPGRVNFKKCLRSNWFNMLIYWRYRREYHMPSKFIFALLMLFLGRALYYTTAWFAGESILWRTKQHLPLTKDILQAQRWIDYCLDGTLCTHHLPNCSRVDNVTDLWSIRN